MWSFSLGRGGRITGGPARLALASLLLGLWLAAPVQAVTIDGRITAGEYDLVYGIDYVWGPDQVPISGGVVGFATDAAGDHYLYYQVPTALVDNTWGCELGTGASCTQIDKYRFAQHTYRKLWRSDSFGVNGRRMALRGTSEGDIEFQVDIVSSAIAAKQAPGSGAQEFSHGGLGEDWLGIELSNNNGWLQDPDENAAFFHELQSSTAWNMEHFGPDGTGAISQNDLDQALVVGYNARQGVFRDSPATDADYTDPTVDNPVAPDGLTEYDDSLFSGWNYVIAFEMKFDADLYGDEWTDPAFQQLFACGTEENPKNCVGFLDTGGAHFSQNKLGTSTLLNPVLLTLIVPEPGITSLLVISFAGLVGIRCRRSQNR